MLRYDHYIPDNVRDGVPLIVLLHGRGSHKGDLIGLQPHLLPDAIVVAPEAPFPAAAWGYGPGWAWYRLAAPQRPDSETFEASRQQLHEFLTDLPGKLPVKPGPLILGGFSQGGTMSLAYALTHPGTVPFVLNFSGFVANNPGVQVTPDRVKGTRIFWGHGTQDPMIPFSVATDGWGLLRQAGANLTAHEYPIGHWIDGSELQDVVKWLRQGMQG